MKILNEHELDLKYRPASELPTPGENVIVWYMHGILGADFDLAWHDGEGKWRHSNDGKVFAGEIFCWLCIDEPVIEGVNDEDYS